MAEQSVRAYAAFVGALVLGLAAIQRAAPAAHQRAGNPIIPIPCGSGEPIDQCPTYYEANTNVTWLADANYAAKQSFGVPGINANGSMDFKTAQLWVQAMNKAKYLGQATWQLPATPTNDPGCNAFNHSTFGFGCTQSDLGELYYGILGLSEPDTAVAIPSSTVSGFKNFQPYLYWSSTLTPKNKNGYASFSFDTGYDGSNVSQNHLYALAMIPGPIGSPPASHGTSLVPSADGRTIYDPVANVTWLADANLAATQSFGVAGIDKDGSMDHGTALSWIAAMNASHGGYLGQHTWTLPPTELHDPSCSLKQTFGFGCTGSPMGELFYGQLGKKAGESVVPVPAVKTGPFYDIQPYLYWSCGESNAPACGKPPAPGFEWSFSFGDGFEGTDVVANDLYVMVYYRSKPAVLPTKPGIRRGGTSTSRTR